MPLVNDKALLLSLLLLLLLLSRPDWTVAGLENGVPK
jgi:hypothetical protein